MSDLESTIRRVLDVTGVVEKGLRGIALVSGNATSATAADAIMVVRSLIGAIEETQAGNLTPAEGHAALDRLLGGLQANDAAAQAALDDKFPRG